MKAVFSIVVIALTLGLAACGSNTDAQDTPVACLSEPAAYEKALDKLPRPVLIEGETRISDCLPDEQSAGDLADVGSAMIETAQALNTRARQAPGGSDNVALGYLLGAVREGSGPTGGIHADLVRRVDAAAHYSPGGKPLPPRFGIALANGTTQGSKSG